MQFDLFISHSSKDAATAKSLVKDLEKRGLSCWLASRDVPLGHSYQVEIVAAIDRCRAVLLLFSDATNRSEHVLREVELAAQEKKPIYPLRIDASRPEGGLKYMLANKQWVEREALGNRLAETLQQLLANAVGAEPPRERVTPPPPPPRPGTNAALIATVAAAAIVLIAGGLFATQDIWRPKPGIPVPAPQPGTPTVTGPVALAPQNPPVSPAPVQNDAPKPELPAPAVVAPAIQPAAAPPAAPVVQTPAAPAAAPVVPSPAAPTVTAAAKNGVNDAPKPEAPPPAVVPPTAQPPATPPATPIVQTPATPAAAPVVPPPATPTVTAAAKNGTNDAPKPELPATERPPASANPQVAALPDPRVPDAPATTPEIAGAPPAAVTPGKLQIFKECDVCPQMVIVPAGRNMIGAQENERSAMPEDGPQREVVIAKPFAAGRSEISFDEWFACVAEGGCNSYRPGNQEWGEGLRPVIYVSWADARAYVAWLSRKTGATYRLLSEAEWEYAARGCASLCRSTPFWFGVDISNKRANYDWRFSYEGSPRATPPRRTVEIWSSEPNPFGLLHMHGNVREWVEDCWNTTLETLPKDGSARLTGDCGSHVTRGGSWADEPKDLRSAKRGWEATATRRPQIGFRVARTLAP